MTLPADVARIHVTLWCIVSMKFSFYRIFGMKQKYLFSKRADRGQTSTVHRKNNKTLTFRRLALRQKFYGDIFTLINLLEREFFITVCEATQTEKGEYVNVGNMTH